MNKANKFQIAKVQPQGGIAYKSVAYKKKRVVLIFPVIFEKLPPAICDVLFCYYDLNVSTSSTFVIVFFSLNKLTVSCYL